MNAFPRRANYPTGPEHLRTGYRLVYAPRHQRDPFPWLDAPTTIRFSRLEVEEHPLTAALADLPPAGRRSLSGVSVHVFDDAVTGDAKRPEPVVRGSSRTLDALERRGLAQAMNFTPLGSWYAVLTPLGVEVARAVIEQASRES